MYLFPCTVLYLTLVVSCNRQPEYADGVSPKIGLKTPQDQFLRNFIIVGQDGLSVEITCNDALFAGATADGYADLQSQVTDINASFNEKVRNHWQQQTANAQMLTKSNAVFEGTYDKYNVLESDKFLENFVHAKNGEILLTISEEQAVLCGATVEGYRTVKSDVVELNRMVQADYSQVLECFDAKRNYILQVNNRSSVALSKAPIETPPQTYAFIELSAGMRQGSCSFYGPTEVIGVVGANYMLGQVVLTERSTGKSITHWWGFTTHDIFKAGLIYPEGGYYSFTVVKGTDNYDAWARIVDVH